MELEEILGTVEAGMRNLAGIRATVAINTTPRGDEDRLHMSDVTACPRAVWYRRNGDLENFASRNYLMMQRGVSLEVLVREGISRAFSRHNAHAEIYHETSLLGDMRAWFDPITGNGGLRRFEEPYPDDPNVALGHLDLYIVIPAAHFRRIGILVEIKTTTFLVGDFAPARYVSQACAYAIAAATEQRDGLLVDALYTLIVEISAVTGEWRTSLVPKDSMAEMAERLEYRAAVTGPDEPEPPGHVPVEWFVEKGRKPNKVLVNLLCTSYCTYTRCEFNKANVDAQSDEAST